MTQSPSVDGSAVIPCRLHPSGFTKADSNFYSLDILSDGCVYYTLSSHNIDTHGRVYRYDPAADKLTMMFDLGDASGETGMKFLPQGKSHSPFYELDGWVYLATHYGYFATTDQREEPAPVPEGYKPYPGGHIIRFNPSTGQTENLAVADPEEGIITFNMDARRGRIYGLSWPKGFFLVYDIEKRKLHNLGPVSRGGETGRGDQYFCLVRSFAIDPRDGCVYFTNADGAVHRYSPDTRSVGPFDGVTLRRDILGEWDPHRPGHQGYNWRDIVWHEPSQCFYGVHPKSGWLFRFDPPNRRLDLVERIAARELLTTGTFEPFRYGYLTLQLAPDGHTLHYLTSTWAALNPDGSLEPASARMSHWARRQQGPEHRVRRLDDGRRIIEVTHLVTYDLANGAYADHGVLRLDDGRYPRMSQCFAVHPGGRSFTAPWIERTGAAESGQLSWECDLISYATPSTAR